MNLEITEEEREFLHRICIRAENFVKLNIDNPSIDAEKDLNSIVRLIMKLKPSKREENER